MRLKAAWAVLVALHVVLIWLALVWRIQPELVRIREALERAWPSNAVIDARETR